MSTQTDSGSGYSSAVLVAAAAGSAVAGLALGFQLAKRRYSSQPEGKNGRHTPRPFYGLRLGSPGAGGDSTDSTPAATPRSLSRNDSANGAGVRMSLVVLVRTDLGLTGEQVAEQSARTVLGIFKKQYKRRDPNLRTWEDGGSKMKVLGVGSQHEMLVQQAAARSLAIPTHTFAGSDRVNKQRSVMAVGPAPADQLDQLTAALAQA